MNDKRRAEEKKAKDKKEAQERNGTVVICMDLQGVLLVPSIDASSIYCKTKLAVHNFTPYNMVTKDAVRFVWHEAEGGLTSNEFTCCIIDHLSSLSGTNKIVLYSDQWLRLSKQNSVQASALSAFSLQRECEVQLKYLVKGHTHMEVDSMHSLIKRKLKNIPIYSPMDYLTIFRTSSVSPRPYEVMGLNHCFFKNYGQVSTFKTIRPG
ncbi:hypothetical protein PoB_004149000 [Plakobranchus ocellatus]|uniref:DUF7869 domain-containing protein n=1 Tax=Plakobranchus ocellatus TaxID=259542 RepID=A0AAV4B7C1_9GAST|nr:hypothetical protein PoB_004149000 [Plakobranchus ocellatus]